MELMQTCEWPPAGKLTSVTRRIPPGLRIDWGPLGPLVVGDLLLCEVVEPSLHNRIEAPDGSRSKLYPGDRIVCALGNRYATSLLEGSADIADGHADLLSASGLCGQVGQRVDNKERPTRLRILGQAWVGGRPLNLRSFALASAHEACQEPVWLVVVGSAMDSGKTTACAALIHGLVQAGLRVGAAKLTGTASGRDTGAFRDAGATPVYDFLDCGWPSTAGCSHAELREIVGTLAAYLRAAALDVAVLEIADGLLQPETNLLLSELPEHLREARLLLTARESLAGTAGVARLQGMGQRVVAVSGVVTNSPLARREIELGCDVPCIPTAKLGQQARTLAGLSARYAPPELVHAAV